MKKIIFAFCSLGLSLFALGAELTALSDAELQNTLNALAQQNAQLELDLELRRADCYQRFAVTGCITDARRAQHGKVIALRAEELAVRDEIRRRVGIQHLAELQRKEAQSKQYEAQALVRAERQALEQKQREAVAAADLVRREAEAAERVKQLAALEAKVAAENQKRQLAEAQNSSNPPAANKLLAPLTPDNTKPASAGGGVDKPAQVVPTQASQNPERDKQAAAQAMQAAQAAQAAQDQLRLQQEQALRRAELDQAAAERKRQLDEKRRLAEERQQALEQKRKDQVAAGKPKAASLPLPSNLPSNLPSASPNNLSTNPPVKPPAN